jgi:hypothetical protein
MTQQPQRHGKLQPEVDSDIHKGAIEGAPDAQASDISPGLDEQGLPDDEVAIAQDVLGANEDETQG